MSDDTDPIEKQLEGRLWDSKEWTADDVKAAHYEAVVSDANSFANESAALRRLCREVLAYNPGPLPHELKERLRAAANGEEVK